MWTPGGAVAQATPAAAAAGPKTPQGGPAGGQLGALDTITVALTGSLLVE